MRIDDKFGQPENFSAEMESISETRFLTFFCGQGLDRFQVEVVVEMQVVQILAVDQQVEHVIALTTNLKSDLNPIQTCRLEKLGCLE